MSSPYTFYKNQSDTYKHLFDKFSKKTDRISVLRVFVFLTGIVLVYFATTFNLTITLITLGIFITVFSMIVFLHSKSHKQKSFYKILLQINKSELKALKGNVEDFEDGAEFNTPDHPYSDDLDIFGQHSLFQAINRCSSEIGKNKLAQWFLNITKNRTIIRGRQKAIEELSGLAEWRQQFQAIGLQSKDMIGDFEDIKNWAKEKAEFNKPVHLFLIIVIPIITFALLSLSILGEISERIFILYVLFVPIVITWKNFQMVNQIHKKLGKKTELLKKYSALLKIIEEQAFSAGHLQKLKNALQHQNKKPSEILRKLSKISSAFDNRLNMLAGILLNIFLLWDLLQSVRLNYWKKKYAQSLPDWFKTMGELDALNSLANFHFNHPENSFPVLSDKEFFIDAREMGHPMILKKQRVNNDIRFDDWKNFVIITGANMAGKSTFLRTLGVNMLLASMGASVCAGYFEWSPVQIFTSLRTKDSLDKNESYFFAELKRLKEIIDLLNNNQPLFIILDEILKGTNSKDKQSGSMQLIEQLIGLNASGIIATHDLILGELIKSYPDNIINKCFEVDLSEDKLEFDYKLRDGISKNMNATYLMKKMGITI